MSHQLVIDYSQVVLPSRYLLQRLVSTDTAGVLKTFSQRLEFKDRRQISKSIANGTDELADSNQRDSHPIRSVIHFVS